MIATIGLAGSNDFDYARVGSREEGEAFGLWWLAQAGESQETLSAYREREVLTEKEAARRRWRDGSRVFGEHVESFASRRKHEEAERAASMDP